MKSIVLLLPYFGKFPNYFELFLKSCGTNSTIDWVIFTDQRKSSYNIPKNVKWVEMSFDAVRARIESILQAAPGSPYELCKYRVAYHLIFDKYVCDYDFWGFCDCDLIFGDIRSFVSDDILSVYPKISWRGHLTMFRNTEPYNSAYATKIEGYKSFEGCIRGSDGTNLFDEVGINKIFDYKGYPIYTKLPLCDLRIRNCNFVCNHDIFAPETNKNQIFHWSNGTLERIYALDGKMERENVIYVHFLKREMDVPDKSIASSNSYLIVPNCFLVDRKLTLKELLHLSRPRFYFRYWKKRITPANIIKKVKEKLSANKHEADQYFPR